MNFISNLNTYLSKDFIESLLESLDEKRTNSLILNTEKINKETRLWDLTLENLGWDKIFISLYLYKYKYKKIDIFFYLCYNF